VTDLLYPSPKPDPITTVPSAQQGQNEKYSMSILFDPLGHISPVTTFAKLLFTKAVAKTSRIGKHPE